MPATVEDAQDKLHQEILADARRQADRILRRARQEAATMVEQARREAERQRDEWLASARATADRRTALLLARLPVDQGRMRAVHVEKLLTAVRDEAATRLAPRQTPLARDLLLARIAEAIDGMAGDTFELSLSPADSQTLAEIDLDALRRMTGKPTLCIERGAPLSDQDSGPVLRDAAGRQIWDNRMTARLRRLWPALRRQLATATRLNAALTNPAEGQP